MISVTFWTISIMLRWIKKRDQLEGGTGYGDQSEELSKLDDKFTNRSWWRFNGLPRGTDGRTLRITNYGVNTALRSRHCFKIDNHSHEIVLKNPQFLKGFRIHTDLIQMRIQIQHIWLMSIRIFGIRDLRSRIQNPEYGKNLSWVQG